MKKLRSQKLKFFVKLSFKKVCEVWDNAPQIKYIL